MMDDNYNVKVIDLGDARKVDEQLDEDEDEDDGDQLPGAGQKVNMGRRDTFVGTVNYQSPEVINEDP